MRSSKWFSFQHFKPAISRGRCCLKDLTFSASCQESALFTSPASTEKDAAFLCVKTLSGAFGMYMKKKRGFYVAVPARGLISTAKFFWAIQKFFQAIISNQSPILMCWIFLLFALQLLIRCNAFRISTCFGKNPFAPKPINIHYLPFRQKKIVHLSFNFLFSCGIVYNANSWVANFTQFLFQYAHATFSW